MLEVENLATTDKSTYQIAKVQKWVNKTNKKTIKNNIKKSSLRTATKKAKESIVNKDESAAEKLKNAVKLIDKAAAEGIIHKNKANRKKSQLFRALNRMEIAE